MKLVDITSPSPSSGEDPPSTGTFWPRLRDTLVRGTLLDPFYFHHLSLECPICLETMTIFPHQHRRDPSMHGFDHSARILPCGHIFGTKCIFRCLHENFPVGTCPTCRRVLQHSRCKHPISGLPMPYSIEDVEGVPPVLGEVLGEEEGEVAEDCSECKISSVIMGLDVLAEAITTLDSRLDRIAISAEVRNLRWSTFPPTHGPLRQEVLDVRDMDPRGEVQQLCDIAADALVREDRTKWRSDNLRGIQIRPHLYRSRAVRRDEREVEDDLPPEVIVLVG